MNAITIHESETVTRSIARWGSAAAAIIFGVAFVSDQPWAWYTFSVVALPTGLIVAMFAGYALACTKRYEVLGSVIAVVSMIAAYVAYMVPIVGNLLPGFTPNPIFLAVGLPALIHLVAVVLHRHEEYGVKA